MKNGYFVLSRKLFSSFLWEEKREYSRFEAFMYLLYHAQYGKEPRKVSIKNKILVQNRGELLRSQRRLASDWGWTPKRVNSWLKTMTKNGSIRNANETVTTRITICNYDKYQDLTNYIETQTKPEGNRNETETKRKGQQKKSSKSSKTSFIKPTIEEIEKYCLERNFGRAVEPKEFVDHYEANGWTIGKSKKKMENWKLCVNTWNRNSLKRDPSLKPKPVKETIVICLDRDIWKNSRYQADGLWETADIIYTNFKPAFIDDDEREEVELNTNKFIEEYCDGGY